MLKQKLENNSIQPRDLLKSKQSDSQKEKLNLLFLKGCWRRWDVDDDDNECEPHNASHRSMWHRFRWSFAQNSVPMGQVWFSPYTGQVEEGGTGYRRSTCYSRLVQLDSILEYCNRVSDNYTVIFLLGKMNKSWFFFSQRYISSGSTLFTLTLLAFKMSRSLWICSFLRSGPQHGGLLSVLFQRKYPLSHVDGRMDTLHCPGWSCPSPQRRYLQISCISMRGASQSP